MLFVAPGWWHDCVKIDASIILDAKYDQRLREQGMLQATGYPAEIADFYSAISAGYWEVFLVAKTVQLVMAALSATYILDKLLKKDSK